MLDVYHVMLSGSNCFLGKPLHFFLLDLEPRGCCVVNFDLALPLGLRIIAPI